MAPLLPLSAARVFIDGVFAEPKLAHPEGVAVHDDGSVWCGTENGHLIRVCADGSSMQALGCTNGFLLGLAFDAAGNCFMCDLKHAAIFRYDGTSGTLQKFASSGIAVPNYPVVDAARDALYVSDSYSFDAPGGGIYRYSLSTGQGGLWYEKPMHFANGMALTPDGSGLYVIESTASRLSHIDIGPDGAAGTARVVVDGLLNVPDGVLVMPDGSLLLSCYEPSRIYRYDETRGLELLIEDPQATILAHPTNIARRCDKLFTANLGRWHLTEIDISPLL